MRAMLSVGFFALLSFVMLPTSNAAVAPDADAQRGCCSHHHGVCGCNAGNTMCCDGSQSPTCHC